MRARLGIRAGHSATSDECHRVNQLHLPVPVAHSLLNSSEGLFTERELSNWGDMDIRSWLKNALGFAAMSMCVAVPGTAGAQAQGMGAVERSGNTYHRAVCSRAIGLGEARCHAHVVTDAAGNERNGKVTPNATPAGFGEVA